MSTLNPDVQASTSSTPGDAETELSLLAELAAGDSKAFWKLWQRHSTRLLAVCLREMEGNRADAEDALGQAMLKALAKLPPVAREIHCPVAWLMRTTRNICLDIHRHRARSLRAEEHLKILTGSPVAPADHHEPHDGTAPRCGEADPASLIAALPPRLREVLVLRTIHRMTYDDIATKLQLTCASARKRVQQARQVLRRWRDHGVDARPAREHPSRLDRGTGAASSVDGKPVRVRQKISTLRAYVQRHPAGWKKRLQLGDLLYATGSWIEAADCYELVLSRRPWLTPVAVRLESIQRILSAREEAAGPQADATPVPDNSPNSQTAGSAST